MICRHANRPRALGPRACSSHRSTRLARSVAVCLLVAALARAEETPSDADWRARGAAAVQPFKQQLMAELTAALAKGPVNAVEVCRLRAPQIADAAGSSAQRMGRSSHRLRNPANAPRPWVEPLLAAYTRGVATGPLVLHLPSGGVGYVEPIYAQPLCLTCHGEAIDPALRARIRELYPRDRATGFRDGDLRGVFWVEFAAPDGQP